MSFDWLGYIHQKDADDRDRHKHWYNLSDEQKDIVERLLDSGILEPYLDIYLRRENIPEVCRYCNNHPSNGGSGVCHCTLGGPKITC